MKTKLILFLIFTSSFLFSAFAGSATWNANPRSNSWSDPANWTPATVPNSPTDVATFAVSNETNPVPTGISLGEMIFNAGASHYFMYPGSVGYFGAGVVNNSGINQDFYLETSNISFQNSASAGDLDHYFMIEQSYVDFLDDSTAGTALFDVLFDSEVSFNDQATAGNATFNCASGVIFQPGSSAGAAIFNISGEDHEGGGSGAVIFYGGDGGSASFAAGGGKIIGGVLAFDGASTGATCNVTVSSRQGQPTGDLRDGHLDISGHDSPGLSIRSLAGDGLVLLGTNSVTVGANDVRSATFSGLIQDSGSLVKVGRGSLTLTGANTYTGGTTVNGGTLLANNATGSGLGAGAVQALSGFLGGSGIISGRVTMGTGNGTGATLAPGANSIVPGTLTIGKQLALKSDATYRVTLNSNTPATDLVVANGVRILGAQIVLLEMGSATLPPGTVLTVISNTGRKPINETFANLPDGGTITAGSNTYQANYEGGDGNDLTLTVL